MESTAGAGQHRRLFAVLVAAALFACLILGVVGANAYLTLGSSFGESGNGDGEFNQALGVGANEETGDVYVVDTGNNRVERFDAEGNYLSQFGSAGSGNGQFQEPRTVAVDQSDGSVYVLDMGNARVQKFDAAGSFVEEFGSAGSGDGQFSNPLGIAVDPTTGDVLVADTGNNRIQRFSPAGAYISQFGETGSEDGKFENPSRLAVDSTGDVYVLEKFGRIQKLTSAGAFLNLVPDNFPFDLAVDQSNDHLLVLEFDSSFEKTQITEHAPGGETIESFQSSTGPPQSLLFEDALAFNSTNRMAYVADGNRVQKLFQPPPIFNQTAAPTYTEATLGARISPEGEETEYHFEYGLTDSYGNSTPTLTIPAGNAPARVSAQILNLAEGTTYHFRAVSVNGQGENQGEDRTFTTLSRASAGSCPNADIREAQGANALGDCRAFEMVSPLEKNGSDIYIHGTQSSPDGEAVVFQSAGAFAGSESSPHGADYIGRRSPSGWSVEPISPYQTPDGNAAFAEDNFYEAFTPDLGKGVLVSSHPPYEKNADTSNDQRRLYLRTGPGEYLDVSPPAANPVGFPAIFNSANYVGSSTDMTHVFFESDRHLTSDAPPEGTMELYEWTEGAVRVVPVLPNDEVASEGGSLGRGTTNTNTQTAVSSDGTQVVFQAGSPSQVYLRIDGETTVPLSVSQKTGSEGELAPSGATFFGSATDGETLTKIYFVSPSELTDDANTGGGAGDDLYEYDVASGTLTDLTVATGPENPIGAGVSVTFTGGWKMGAATDGSYLYFNASGVLAPGGSENNPRNLYVLHEGEITFVTSYFSFTDPIVSDNGERVLIFTDKQLTDAETDGFQQAYLYDAPSNTIKCISCPSGRPADGEVATSGFLTGYTHVQKYAPRNISPDGSHVYFETTQALDPRDSNGQADVYEWEDGEGVSLVSSGRSGEGAHFLDASASGRDVFIVTRERLVATDRDSNTDVYDARTDGGLPLPPVPSAACEGDACQRPPNPPNDPTPASASFSGAGNPVPKFKKHRKHHHKKKHRKRHRQGRHAQGKHTTRGNG